MFLYIVIYYYLQWYNRVFLNNEKDIQKGNLERKNDNEIKVFPDWMMPKEIIKKFSQLVKTTHRWKQTEWKQSYSRNHPLPQISTQKNFDLKLNKTFLHLANSTN